MKTYKNRAAKSPSVLTDLSGGMGAFLLPVRLDVFAAVAMKNDDFWDIKTQFLLHRRHITSPLQRPTS
jgi:hypothetical protein